MSLLTDRLKHHADKSKKDKHAQLVASQPSPGTNAKPAVALPPPSMPPSPQKKAQQPSPKKGIFQVAEPHTHSGQGLASQQSSKHDIPLDFTLVVPPKVLPA